MKMRTAFFIFMLFTISLFAQTDSLLKLISKQKEDSTKVNQLIALSKMYFNTSPDSATMYLEQAKNLADEIDFKKGVGYAIKFMGNLNYVQGKYVDALQHWEKALAMFDSLGDKKGSANIMSNMGALYENEGSHEKALELYLKALKIAEQIKDTLRLASVMSNIGVLYYNNPLTQDKALEFDLQALKLSERTKDNDAIGSITVDLGEIYMDKNEDSLAQFYFNMALKAFEGSENMSYALNQVGKFYLKKGNFSLAIATHEHAFDIAEKLDAAYDQAQAKLDIGLVYLKKNELVNAIKNLREAEVYGKKVKANSELEKIYKGLSQAYASLNDFANAFKYQGLLIAIKDTIYNTETDKKLGTLQFNFDIAKKQGEIDLLNKNGELRDKDLETQKFVRNGFIIGFAIMLLFAAIFFLQRNKIKKGNIALQMAKDRAEQSEKFEQQFLANMSHEIRTPMNAVMGMTNLLLLKNPRVDQLKYLDGMKKSSETLLHIINDILDISKIESGKIELEEIDFSIGEVANQVKQILSHKAEEKGLHLLVEIKNNFQDVVIGDPVRLNQVLINLAGNAIKFTEKGSVGLKVEKGTDENKIKFSVVDTGIGIPKNKLEKVFESFSQAHSSDTRKFGGTGLGLTISKQLVELMGGNISIESEEGSGTIFSFEINFKSGSAERLEQQLLADEIDGSILDGLKILVVDDNEFNRTVAKDTLLAKSNVEITEAANGRVALDLFSKNYYDVVLMDVQMPVMDGYEATKIIRENYDSPKNKIPVIALTASVIRSDLDKCRQAGMNDYVPKPFKASELFSSIAKMCGREIKYVQQKISENKIGRERKSEVTNLSYLEKFCESDGVRMKKYIQMFLDSAPALIEKINASLADNNFSDVANQIHGFKTKWIMMGMSDAKDLAIKIEYQCREDAGDKTISENIAQLIQLLQTAIAELR